MGAPSLNPTTLLPIVVPHAEEKKETDSIAVLDQTSAPPSPPPQGPSLTPPANPPQSPHTKPDDDPEALEEAFSRLETTHLPTESELEQDALLSSTPTPPGLPPPPAAAAISSLALAPPISEVIARFKPSPRDVISGIAPHVFDERRRRRASSSSSSSPGKRSACPRWFNHQRCPKASPLRRSVVLSWDEHTIYLDETSSYKMGEISNRLSIDIATGQQHQQQQQQQKAVSEPASPATQKKKPLLLGDSPSSGGWRKFKLDGHLFKTLVSRMKKRRNPRSSLALAQ